jgi:hypothetical protein
MTREGLAFLLRIKIQSILFIMLKEFLCDLGALAPEGSTLGVW